MDDNAAPPPKRRFAPGNTAADGTYLVGKNRPPAHGKFRKGDGRKRGRRTKGTRNLATDFREEMADVVAVGVQGKSRRVSKQRSLVMRLVDNAMRGQNGALRLALEYADRYAAMADPASSAVESEPLLNFADLSDDELRQWEVLLCKLLGEPVEPIVPHPLDYLSDPDDERNYHDVRTPDGIRYRQCRLDSVDDAVVAIDNRAYASAARPRRPGCDRRRY